MLSGLHAGWLSGHDGALDVRIGNNGDAPLLPKNNAAGENNWLGLKLNPYISTTEEIENSR